MGRRKRRPGIIFRAEPIPGQPHSLFSSRRHQNGRLISKGSSRKTSRNRFLGETDPGSPAETIKKVARRRRPGNENRERSLTSRSTPTHEEASSERKKRKGGSVNMHYSKIPARKRRKKNQTNPGFPTISLSLSLFLWCMRKSVCGIKSGDFFESGARSWSLPVVSTRAYQCALALRRL